MTFKDPLVVRMTSFLTEIGLGVRPGTVAEDAVLPGIDVQAGVLVIDEDRLLYPGDILHEAGHIAVTPPERRAVLDHNVGSDGAEEMMALAWSYAAALAIGIDPALVFHEHGYKGDGAEILRDFRDGWVVGLPVLQWAGMAYDEAHAEHFGRPAFPAMERWLRV
jgi:hypothetical protein